MYLILICKMFVHFYSTHTTLAVTQYYSYIIIVSNKIFVWFVQIWSPWSQWVWKDYTTEMHCRTLSNRWWPFACPWWPAWQPQTWRPWQYGGIYASGDIKIFITIAQLKIISSIFYCKVGNYSLGFYFRDLRWNANSTHCEWLLNYITQTINITSLYI